MSKLDRTSHLLSRVSPYSPSSLSWLATIAASGSSPSQVLIRSDRRTTSPPWTEALTMRPPPAWVDAVPPYWVD